MACAEGLRSTDGDRTGARYGSRKETPHEACRKCRSFAHVPAILIFARSAPASADPCSFPWPSLISIVELEQHCISSPTESSDSDYGELSSINLGMFVSRAETRLQQCTPLAPELPPAVRIPVIFGPTMLMLILHLIPRRTACV